MQVGWTTLPWLMRLAVKTGESVVLASDAGSSEDGRPSGRDLSVTMFDTAAAEHSFVRLADGGEIQMPLGETLFAILFGMVTDRFGVSWPTVPRVLPELLGGAEPESAQRTMAALLRMGKLEIAALERAAAG